MWSPVPATWTIELLSPWLLLLSTTVKVSQERKTACSSPEKEAKDTWLQIFWQSLDYKIAVTNYCCMILCILWKDFLLKKKKKSSSMEINFIQSKFHMVKASTAFIKSHATTNVEHSNFFSIDVYSIMVK